MPSAGSRFWLGRLEFTGLGAEGLRRRLQEALLAGGRLEGDHGPAWVVAEVSVTSECSLVVGRLGKCRRQEVLRPPDQRHSGFHLEALDGEVVDAVSWFVVDVAGAVIAVEDKRPRISPNQASESLCHIVNSTSTAQSGGGNLRITQVVAGRERVLPSLARFLRVTSVSAELKPSNPETSEEGAVIDAYIKELRARRLKLEAEAGQQGLNPDATLMRSALSHTDAGHGEASIEGADQEGRPLSVSTSGGPLMIHVPIREHDPERAWANDVAAEAHRALDQAERPDRQE